MREDNDAHARRLRISKGSATCAHVVLRFPNGQYGCPLENRRTTCAHVAEPGDMNFFLTYLQLVLPTSQPPPNVGRVSNSTPLSPTQPPHRASLPTTDAGEGAHRRHPGAERCWLFSFPYHVETRECLVVLDVVLILLSCKIFAAKSAKFSSIRCMDSTDPCTLFFRVFYEYGKAMKFVPCTANCDR